MITYEMLYQMWLDEWDRYLENVLYALTVGLPVSLLAQPSKTPPTRASMYHQARVRSASHAKGWQTRRSSGNADYV